MKIRILRSWSWELACARSEIRYGGDNPMKLVATDTLQQCIDGDWVAIEIFELPKPLPPETQRERRYREMADFGAELGSKLVAATYAKTKDSAT